MNSSKQRFLHPFIGSNSDSHTATLPSKNVTLIANGVLKSDDLELAQLRELSDLCANRLLILSISLLKDLRMLLISECHVCNEIVVEDFLAVGERDGLEASRVGFSAANVLAGESFGST